MATEPNLHPFSGTPSDKDLAAEVIRQKISHLYAEQPRIVVEPDAKAEAEEVEHVQHRRTSHQQFMYDLSHSGKSLAEIQTAWHQYYVGLPDDEKHQVWQEFYSEHARARQQTAEPAPEPAKKAKTRKPKGPAAQTVGQLKDQLLGDAKQRSTVKLKTKHHLQSILFGLGMGSLVVLIMMFGLFNDRIIAPFITPSRSVTNTPIIGASTAPVSANPEVIIPKINAELPVIYDQHSTNEDDIQNSLESGVVHYATTASPGEKGNVVIFGHSSNNILNKGRYKFAFVLLHELQIGDTFTLTKDGKRYVYQVYQRKIVPPTDVSVLGATDKVATATLITCDPPGTSINRLVVTGVQISPDPGSNSASTAIQDTGQQLSTIPSNSPSLWHRLTSWL